MTLNSLVEYFQEIDLIKEIDYSDHERVRYRLMIPSPAHAYHRAINEIRETGFEFPSYESLQSDLGTFERLDLYQEFVHYLKENEIKFTFGNLIKLEFHVRRSQFEAFLQIYAHDLQNANKTFTLTLKGDERHYGIAQSQELKEVQKQLDRLKNSNRLKVAHTKIIAEQIVESGAALEFLFQLK